MKSNQFKYYCIAKGSISRSFWNRSVYGYTLFKHIGSYLATKFTYIQSHIATAIKAMTNSRKFLYILHLRWQFHANAFKTLNFIGHINNNVSKLSLRAYEINSMYEHKTLYYLYSFLFVFLLPNTTKTNFYMCTWYSFASKLL